VELQDFALQHLYSRLAFADTEGSVLDRRGATAKAMGDHLKLSNVVLQPTAAEIRSDDGRDQYRIGVAQIYASLHNFDDFDGARDRTRDFFEMATKYLENPSVNSVTVRSYDIAPVDSFEDLRDELTATLVGDIQVLRDAVGVPLADAGWVFEFKDAHANVGVRFGPMESAQLQAMLEDEQGEGYPSYVLFLEVLRDLSSDSPKTDPLDWWSRAVEANRGMTKRIGDWLRRELGS
jgi:hypothetical protein